MLKGGIDYMSKEKAIFFSRAFQEGGKYTDVWTKKIEENFSGSGIIDLSGVYKQLWEDKKGDAKGIPYFEGWISWEELYNSEKRYFFSLIDICDFVVSSEAWNHPRRGKYTANVIVEMEYALEIGKKVFGINIEDWRFKEITKEDLIKIKKEKDDEITFLLFLLRSL
jgi:hypothetical protein